MAIAYVTTANTFQQWLISSQDLITTANNLTDGGGAKTFYANTNVVVGNNLTVVGNTTITGDLTVTGNITLDSLGFDDLAVNGSVTIANTLTVTGISTFTGVATMANANVAILSGTSNTAIYTYIASIEASALAFSIALG
jgi:restriction endonuclease Mrr